MVVTLMTEYAEFTVELNWINCQNEIHDLLKLIKTERKCVCSTKDVLQHFDQSMCVLSLWIGWISTAREKSILSHSIMTPMSIKALLNHVAWTDINKCGIIRCRIEYWFQWYITHIHYSKVLQNIHTNIYVAELFLRGLYWGADSAEQCVMARYNIL